MRLIARGAAALALSVVACSGERGGPPADAEDLPAQAPARIVSLIPSVTEVILALGAADRLVARSDYDLDPRLAGLPTVGQGLTPSLEQLTMLGPQLVVAWPDGRSRSVIARLADLGVDIYAPEIQTLEDLRAVIEALGRRLDREAAADSLIRSIDLELDEVRRAVAGRVRPSVFYVVWHDPPTTAGRGTYIDQLIEIAGGRNAFADAPGLWPQVSLEEVVHRQPDLVLLSQTEEAPVGIERLQRAVGWRDLHALREGRVRALDANLYNRPGPGVTQAAHGLARLFHPEAFADAARR